MYLWFIVSLFRLCQITDFIFGHNPKLYLLHVFLLIFGICYCSICCKMHVCMVQFEINLSIYLSIYLSENAKSCKALVIMYINKFILFTFS